MPITVFCSQCGKSLRAPDEMAGKRARCPNCKTVVQIPVAQTGQRLEAPEDETYGLSQEAPPPRPAFVPPPTAARSPEEAYEQAVAKT